MPPRTHSSSRGSSPSAQPPLDSGSMRFCQLFFASRLDGAWLKIGCPELFEGRPGDGICQGMDPCSPGGGCCGNSGARGALGGATNGVLGGSVDGLPGRFRMLPMRPPNRPPSPSRMSSWEEEAFGFRRTCSWHLSCTPIRTRANNSLTWMRKGCPPRWICRGGRSSSRMEQSQVTSPPTSILHVRSKAPSGSRELMKLL
mmetsp:Transcript_24369/g.76687  ORF Transcript_24369/g.76687 Transcript_24369/m.76687 type:complete len:200 (-) Transcript_24369:63-662(-)